MYEPHFSMTNRPFKAAADVSRYFPAASIEDARKRVSLAVERGDGPALIVGAPGTGKTLLLEVLESTHRQHFAAHLLAGAQLCTRRALLQTILHALDLPYENRGEGELRLALIDRLQSRDDPTNGLLLLVDEVHAMPTKLLEELRMLTNLTRDGSPRVRIVLAGLLTFEERLAGPQFEQLSQRIATRCYLMPLDRGETQQYMRAQLAASGVNVEQSAVLFDDDAVDTVYRATDGVPRLVNQLCDHALLLAVAAGAERVPSERVDEAWCDLQQLPTPSPSPISTAGEDASVVEFGSLSDFGDEPVEPDETTDDPRDSYQHHLASEVVADAASVDATTVAPDTEAQIAAIERSLASAAETIRPDAEAQTPGDSGDPFGASFDDEEVVIDQMASVTPVQNEFVEFSLPGMAESTESSAGDDVPSDADDGVDPDIDASDPPGLRPLPLFVQPDVSEAHDDDPVFPEIEPADEGPAPTIVQLEIVDEVDAAAVDTTDENEDHYADSAEDADQKVPGPPAPVGAATVEESSDRPRFGQLFSSLRRG